MATDIFKKGSIEMLSLLIMQETDIYGYQLSSELRERSGGVITVQEGALYPLLYRMADAGYITGRDEVVETKNGRRRTRVVYHLEQKGRLRLVQLKKEYDYVQEGIQNVFRCSKKIGWKPEGKLESGSEKVPEEDQSHDALSVGAQEGVSARV